MSSNELHDLGLTRYNTATAAITDKDYALTVPSSSTSLAPRVLATAAGPAPKGYESAVHAWNTFQYTTEEVNAREELKGDLHGGQLHRENRAVRELEARMGGGGWGLHDGRGGFGGGHGGFGGFGGGRGGAGAGKRGGIGNTAGGEQGAQLALCAGRKPEGGGPPLAKGMAAEMDKSMFWDGEIV